MKTTKTLSLRQWYEWWTMQNNWDLPRDLDCVSVAGRATCGILPTDAGGQHLQANKIPEYFKVFFKNHDEAILPARQLCKITYER